MPFAKGNKEQTKKKGMKYNEGVNEYLAYIAGGAAREYHKNLGRQFNGEELPESVREAMDRFEKNTEFVAPKLARMENSVNMSLNRIDGDTVDSIFGKITGGKA